MSYFRLLAGAGIALTLVCGACGPKKMDLRTPRVTPVNVVLPGGKVIINRTSTQQVPSLREYPPKSVLRSWNPTKGFRGARKNHGGPGRDGGVWFCGTRVTVAGIPSQLIVFAHRTDGRGPAGRGDYRVHIPAARLSAASGGRAIMHYESYIGGNGVEYYAWIAVIGATCDPAAARKS